jgi:phage tail-like protein
LLACRFLVEVRNVVNAGFAQVSGIESSVDVTDLREGGRNDGVRRLPGGAAPPPPLVLSRGFTMTDDLWRWYCAVHAGKSDRRDVSVLLLDEREQVVWRWTFGRAFPVRWQGPLLVAGESAVAVESLQLAHEGIQPLTSGPER